MEQKELMDALVLTKRIGSLMGDVIDLSKQVLESLDRNDQVSARILVGMRAESINNLKQADEAIKKYLAEMPVADDRERLRGLLNGNTNPKPGEEAVAKQANSNSAQHKRLLELDKVISLKVAREKSVYVQK